MKKILLLLALFLSYAGYVAAETTTVAMESITWTGSGEQTMTGSNDQFSFTAKKGTQTNPTYNTTGKDVRVYAGGTFTVETTDGSEMTAMTFTISTKGKARLADITSDSGNTTASKETWTVTWEGKASSVVFTVGATATLGEETGKSGQFDFTSIDITTEAVNRAEMPVISPESCTFGDEGIAVTITAAEGAKIYYTLDGTVPTIASDLYTAPLAIATTTTVKAIAVEDGKEASKTAEATYTYRSGTFEMSNVLSTASFGNTYDVSGIVTAICTRGFVVTDNSGSMFVYYASGFDVNEYKIGDQVSFSGKLSSYNYGLQFVGTEITVEKWGNVEYTYPEPGTYDWDVAATRNADALAMYVEMVGTLSISGSYYNVVLADAETAQGSIYYATDETKAKIADGQKVTLKGYFISISSGKFINIIVTDVVAEGEATEATKVANIAEFIEKGLTDEETMFEITGEVAVTYQNGYNLYVSDATGQILVYGSLSNSYNNGDRLTGIQGKFQNYYCTYELVALGTSFGEATSGAAVEPTVYTIENLVPEIQNHYVLLENVTLDSKNGILVDAIDAEIGYYNKFQLELPADGVYNVVGVLNYYQAKEAAEAELTIYPIEFREAGETPKGAEAATLAEAIELGAAGETGEITITGDVSVVYKNNRHIYITDGETWSLIYNKTDVEMPAYTNGDVISNFKVTYATNDDQPQFLPVAGSFAEAKAGAEVAPVEINTTDVNAANYHKYVVLTNVDFAATDVAKTGNATDSEGTATIYATWDNTYSDPQVSLAADGKYDIKGFVSSYKGAFQILVTEFADANAVESVVINNPVFAVNGTIVAPEGAEVYNINGVRVNNNNLAAGVYVVKVGNEAVKVLVK